MSKGWMWGFVSLMVLAVGGLAFWGYTSLSATGDDDPITKTSTPDVVTGEGKWTGQLVKKQIMVSNKFNGTAVSATAKVYSEKPTDWGNPRGDFTDASEYEQYAATAGTITLQDYPGKYYVVLTATGYNTDFMEGLVIPDGTGTPVTLSLSDYNSAPNAEKARMARTPTVTISNVTVTLTNQTNREMTEYAYQTIADETEFRGWKAVVTDVEGIKDDADSDGTYDEGVSFLKVTVGDKAVKIFDPSNGINEFDTNGKYEILLDGYSVADGGQMPLKFEIKANTGDYVGANDEKWGEGEGTLIRVDLFDQMGTNRGSVYVVA